MGEVHHCAGGLLDLLDYTVNSVDDAAYKCGYSKYHFIRLFMAQSGMTPWRYILMLNVGKATNTERFYTEVH